MLKIDFPILNHDELFDGYGYILKHELFVKNNIGLLFTLNAFDA